jgi:hypothetical protein
MAGTAVVGIFHSFNTSTWQSQNFTKQLVVTRGLVDMRIVPATFK